VSESERARGEERERERRPRAAALTHRRSPDSSIADAEEALRHALAADARFAGFTPAYELLLVHNSRRLQRGSAAPLSSHGIVAGSVFHAVASAPP
jgi:hypothetical protein